MKSIREVHLPATAWPAVTLALLLLGFATLAWEWRNAHTKASEPQSNVAHAQRRIPRNTSETAVADEK
jgi:hypothetical protein